VKDGVNIAQPAAGAGFSIARTATSWGFWLGRGAFVKGPAAAMELISPANPVSKVLRAVDYGVGAAEAVTDASLRASATITRGSLSATDSILSFAGVEDGHLWNIPAGFLLGQDAAKAIWDVSAMVNGFLHEVDLPLRELNTAGAALSLLQRHSPPRERNPLPLSTDQRRGCKSMMRFAAAAYGAAALKVLGLLPLQAPLDDLLAIEVRSQLGLGLGEIEVHSS